MPERYFEICKIPQQEAQSQASKNFAHGYKFAVSNVTNIFRHLSKSKNSKRAYSKEKVHERDNSLKKYSGFKTNFSTLNGSKLIGSHSKKSKYRQVTKAHNRPNHGLMSNSNTYDNRGTLNCSEQLQIM